MLADESINPSYQVVNANSSETSNMYNMTNGVPAQDSSDADKNKYRKIFCPLSLKLKEKHVELPPFIMSGLGLEPLQELLLLKYILQRHCTHSGTGTKIHHFKRNY